MPRMKTGYKRGIPHENVVGCKVKRCTFTTGGLGGAVLISKGCPVDAGWPFFLGRGVIRAFFVALILFFWGGAKKLPDSLSAVRSQHRRADA